jgi:hypothetical protein
MKLNSIEIFNKKNIEKRRKILSKINELKIKK